MKTILKHRNESVGEAASRLTFRWASATITRGLEGAAMLNRLRRGASLLELLISLAIIGALASLVLGAAMALLTKVHQLGGGCCFGSG